MIIKTANLILRHWRESDAKRLYELARNPNIGPIANWPPHESINDSLNIIKTIFCRPECYAITLKDDIPIGCVELLVYPNGNHYWGEGAGELGYWIGEDYWGQGLAVEASEAILKRAFNELNLNKVYATIKEENFQSKRVLEKLGFEYYDRIHNMDYLGNQFVEIAMILEKF